MIDYDRSLPAVPGGVGGMEIATHRSFEPALAAANAMAAAAPPPPTDWQRYAVAIARHKWFVLAVTLAGTLAGAVGTRFLHPEFAAKAILWFETAGTSAKPADRDNQVISGEEVVSAPGWVELVTSNAVLDSVVRQLRLYLAPATRADSAALRELTVREDVRPGLYRVSVDRQGRTWALSQEDKTVLERGKVGDSIGSDIGLRWAPGSDVLTPERQLSFEITAPYDVSTGLAKRLKPRMDLSGSFLTIPLKGKDPQLTAATVNAIANRMVVVARDLKRLRFEQLSTILGGQYEHARARQDSAEDALLRFQTRNAGRLGASLFAARPATSEQRGTGPGMPEDPALSQPFGMRGSLEQLRHDRRGIEDALRLSPRTGFQISALAAIPSVQQSPLLAAALADVTKKQADLRELRTRYTDEAEPVQRLKADLDSLTGSVIPQLAQDLVTDLQARERVAAPRVDSAFGALRRVPSLSLEESRLERDVQTAAEMATNVRQRYEAAGLALVSTLPDVRVLDQAVVPQRAVMSLAPLLVVLAFLTSLALSVVAIVVRDGVDPKVRYPEQVTRTMRLPILGAVPNVGATGGLTDAAIEALRGLRLRVLHAMHGGSPLLLTVSSPAMGEGKSFVTVNLALAFADAGYRTLLVDGDVRRGAQHIVLGAKQRPGLTDYLAGSATIEQITRQTEYDGLTLLPSGARMHRAPELLLSPRLKALIDELKTNYDIVLVDSPPLAAGADPLILATATKHLLMVLRSGTTDLPLAMSKLEVLDTLPVRTIGVVLNDVRERGAFKYYTYDTTGYVLPRASTGQAGGNGAREDGPHILVQEDESP